MSIIDLTHFLEEGMPVYPGTESPVLAEANTIAKDGFREKKITMFSHTGTHMDAPAHILSGASTLDELSPDTFIANARMADLSAPRESRFIGLEELRRAAGMESGSPASSSTEFLIIRTGWEQYWDSERYFSDFPVLSEEAALWLAGLALKGVGLDAISVDPVESFELPVHRILLGAGMVIVENLANLSRLAEILKMPGKTPALVQTSVPIRIYFLPLKIRDADGSPVRALAEVP